MTALGYAAYAFLVVMVLSAVEDVTRLRIPNPPLALLAAAFLPVSIFSGLAMHAVLIHVGCGVFVLLLGYGLFVAGVFGGGDAKLAAVASLWLGFPAVLPFLIYTTLAGGVVAVIIGAWVMVDVESQMTSDRISRLFSKFTPNLPYGVAFACGAILSLPYSAWLTGATG